MLRMETKEKLLITLQNVELEREQEVTGAGLSALCRTYTARRFSAKRMHVFEL